MKEKEGVICSCSNQRTDFLVGWGHEDKTTGVLTVTNTGLEPSISRAAQGMVLYKIRAASSLPSFLLLYTTLVTENTFFALHGSVWVLV